MLEKRGVTSFPEHSAREQRIVTVQPRPHAASGDGERDACLIRPSLLPAKFFIPLIDQPVIAAPLLEQSSTLPSYHQDSAVPGFL